MSDKRWTVYVCPKHGILSDREADDLIREGTDGTIFGRTPSGDIYTGEFFCDLDGDVDGFCCEPVDEVVVMPVAPVIPITTLREWIDRERMNAPDLDYARGYDRALEHLAALLDAHEGTTDA